MLIPVILFIGSFAITAVSSSVTSQKSHEVYFDNKNISLLHDFYHDSFPDKFLWGVSTSAYQTEGAWNLDGKEESIWDRFCHSHPTKIDDNSTGDIACDSYHHYKEDAKLLKNLEARVFRLSVSWSRILPKGTTEKVNKAGIDYYNNVINNLIANGIEPILTLFHYDLPQNLQENGGFLNEQSIQNFAEYARICFQNFGDRVKRWVTINGPNTFCLAGYTAGIYAPGEIDPAFGPYACAHSLIKAHALVYQIYKEQFRVKQKGKVGIAVDFWWQEPEHPDSESDKLAAEQTIAFRFGWIVNPLIYGDYPSIMKKIIDVNSKKEKRNESRLPVFDDDWKKRINGSLDFLGINHYTTELVRFRNSTKDTPSWESDSGTERFFDPTWPPTGSPSMKVVPWGLRKALNYIRVNYNNVEVIVTENGVSDDSGGINDSARATYFRLYINEVLKAIKLDGCKVTGYLLWSLLDSFQWNKGYTEKFGVYQVDFNSQNRTRTPKKSVKSIAKIFRDNGFLKLNFHSLVNIPATSMNSTSIFSPSKLIIVMAVTPFVVMYTVYSSR